MVKKFLYFIIVLLIFIAGIFLVTNEDKQQDETKQALHSESIRDEEMSPLIKEVRAIIKKSNNIFLSSSKEEIEEVIREAWDDPEFALEMNRELIDWILSRETNITDIETNFSDESITSTENGDFITYTATVEIILHDKDSKKIHKEITGIFNVVKRKDNTYKIQNLQLL